MKFLNLQRLVHGYMCLGQAAQFSSTTGIHHSSNNKATRERRDANLDKKKTKKKKKKKKVVKVIKSDGVVDIYRKPIKASELMKQLPDHLVCHSQSLFIGRKIPPVSPQHKLQLGHTYFVLPIHLFQTVLSFVSVASSLSSFNNASQKPPSKALAMGTCQVFEIRKAPSGTLQVRVSDEFVSKLIQQEEGGRMYSSSSDASVSICTTSELQKDYTQLVSYRQWKPKLETIKESKKKKLSFWIKKSPQFKNHDKTKPSKTHKSADHHRSKCPKLKAKAKKSTKGESAIP